MSSVEKKFFVSYVRTYVRSGTCSKSLPALILRVLASFVNSKTVHKLILLSVKTRTAVPPRGQQQGRLPHGNKVSSVDAHICVATSPLTLEVLVTWTDLPNGHIDEHAIKDGESATSV